MQPVIKLIMDARKTAPAAMSFTSFIAGWTDLLTTFESFSIEVLIISRLRTSAEQNKIESHSSVCIFNTIPNRKVINAINNSILKFFSELKQYLNPSNA